MKLAELLNINLSQQTTYFKLNAWKIDKIHNNYPTFKNHSQLALGGSSAVYGALAGVGATISIFSLTALVRGPPTAWS